MGIAFLDEDVNFFHDKSTYRCGFHLNEEQLQCAHFPGSKIRFCCYFLACCVETDSLHPEE